MKIGNLFYVEGRRKVKRDKTIKGFSYF